MKNTKHHPESTQNGFSPAEDRDVKNKLNKGILMPQTLDKKTDLQLHCTDITVFNRKQVRQAQTLG